MTEEQAVYDEIAEANRTAGGDMADRQVAKIHDYERKMERAREVVEGQRDTLDEMTNVCARCLRLEKELVVVKAQVRERDEYMRVYVQMLREMTGMCSDINAKLGEQK